MTCGIQAQWKPIGNRIKTKWANKVNPNEVLPEYPRPIMERKDWKNLNGIWKYAIIQKGDRVPDKFDGEILVPFAIESYLSGVAGELMKNKSWFIYVNSTYLLLGKIKRYCFILVQ